MNRQQTLQNILKTYENNKTLFVTTDGLISRDFYAIKKDNVFPMTGSMGLVSAIGLGLALNTKKRVIVINGDGGYLMSLGTQALLEHYNLKNLLHVVLDNGCYETTGGQKTVKIPFMHCVSIIKIKPGGEPGPRIDNLRSITKKFKEDLKCAL